jgi:hypothetical protein
MNSTSPCGDIELRKGATAGHHGLMKLCFTEPRYGGVLYNGPGVSGLDRAKAAALPAFMFSGPTTHPKSYSQAGTQ